jgi:hypothetical protein
VAMPFTKEKEKKNLSFLGGFFGKESLQHKNISFSENYGALGVIFAQKNNLTLIPFFFSYIAKLAKSIKNSVSNVMLNMP